MTRADEPVIVIPARHASSRFPGKPLVEIAGVPLIQRVWRQCVRAVQPERVYVATDDERIANVCQSAGIQVLTTPSDCPTGTDRLAACLDRLEAECIINVQGDEPLVSPEDIQAVVDTAARHPEWVINAYCPIDQAADYHSATVPKVVLRPDGRLLYMSRSPIPGSKDGTFQRAWKQVCIYAFPRTALSAFAAHGAKTALEDEEDIEILRFLELGWDVRMVEVSSSSVAVDVPDDVARVEAALQGAGLP